MIAVLMTGCAGSGAPKDATDRSHDAGFDQTMRAADSLYNNMQFRSAYDLYLQMLDTEEAKTDNEKRLNVLNSLCMASELAGHKAEQTKWLQQQLDLARQTGNAYHQSTALLTMGKRLFYEGDQQQGIKYVNEAIEMAEKTDLKTTDHLIHSHLIILAGLYDEMKDYDNALKTDERNLQLTKEGTRWGDDPNAQLIDRRMALAKMASVLTKKGDLQRADSVYNAWKAVQYEGNHARDYFIVDYLRRRGRYQETVPVYQTLIQQVREHGDTLGEMMNTAKWGLAWVYKKMGNYQQATELYSQVLDIQDTLKNRKARKNAQELAAVYKAQEQEKTILQQQAENTRQQAILIIELLALFAVIALAVIVIVKNRAIHRKNQLLAAQITEAVNYKQMYWDEKRAQKQSQKQAQTPKPAAVSDDLKELSDEQLFLHINEVVMKERLFLDPNFGRQAIIDRFQLSKDRVGAVFSKGSEHVRLNKYILQLRLEYAAHLLINEPERTIVQIAADSGFGSSPYFSDRFRQHYGMTPSDFRNEAAKSGMTR
jgi:AraC-like DNA-binding protein